ncbi:MAG: DUF167 domain-containing protein [Acidobacteriota bacterium]
MLKIDEKDGKFIIKVRVIPRAGRSAIVGEHDGALKIKIAAPPVDGAANDELIAVLARALDTAKNCIAIVAGHSSRTKRVSLRVSREKIDSILQAKS